MRPSRKVSVEEVISAQVVEPDELVLFSPAEPSWRRIVPMNYRRQVRVGLPTDAGFDVAIMRMALFELLSALMCNRVGK